LIENGEVFSWGSNDLGQLGINSKETHYSPQKVQCFHFDENQENLRIIDINAGFNHSFMITSNSSLFSFGGNSFGQLGLCTKLKQTIAKGLAPLPEKPKKVSCGYNYTLILTEKGKIYACGDNSSGQLGLGKEIMSSSIPILIKFNKDEKINEEKINKDEKFNTEESFTKNEKSKNNEKFDNKEEINNEKKIYNDEKINNEEKDQIIQISAGKHSSALTSTGVLYTWGMSLIGNSYVPKKVEIAHKFKEVCIGGDYGVGVSQEGRVYVWGRNECGELGLGDYCGRMEIVENKHFIGKKVLGVSCGENFVMAIGENIEDKENSKENLSLEEELELNFCIEEQSELNLEKEKMRKLIEKKENLSEKRKKSKEKQKKYRDKKENSVEKKENNGNLSKKKKRDFAEISINEFMNNKGVLLEKTKENTFVQDDFKKINEVLRRNVENLNGVLKVYCDENKNKTFDWEIIKKKEVIKEIDEEEKIRYLIEKLHEKDQEIAKIQAEMMKKEALEEALLYKIVFLEDSLALKEEEIFRWKK